MGSIQGDKLLNKTALVFGEDTRSFLSVIRSLGQAGMLVDVVTFSNISPALGSKYIRDIYRFNYQAFDESEWKSLVRTLLLEKQYDIAIPCDERALYPLLEFRDSLDVKTRFAIPDKENLGPLFNKHQTRQLAQQCGVPVAKGENLQLSEYSFEQLTAQFGLPFVIKPVQSYAQEKLSHRQSVSIVKDQAAFTGLDVSEVPCLVESYFPGYGIGVSIFSSLGEVKAAFAHARVAEPESGGGSSYRKAIALDPSMLDACQKICIALNYSGVAMFEFKFNPENQSWILIEINARFWGSLPLAIHAGVDFPYYYARDLLGLPNHAKLTYNMHAYARSLTADIYDIKNQFEIDRARKGTSKALLKLFGRFAGFARLLTGNEKIDSFAWQDERPFFKEIQQLLQGKIRHAPLLKYHFKRKRVKALTNKLQSPVNEIIVICYGNIMRSPFAEKLLKQKLANAGIKHIAVSSFGFHQHENRQSPERCILAAQAWNIDLSEHRSRWLKQPHIKQQGQLAIIFDEYNEHKLDMFYHDAFVVQLADLAPESDGYVKTIADPYDYDDVYLRQCYRLINDCLDKLVHNLSK